MFESLRKSLTRIGIPLAAVVLLFVVTIIYYYFTTSASTILISVGDMPSSLSAGLFSSNALINRVEAHLNNVINTADSVLMNELAEQESLSTGPTLQKIIPANAVSNVPSPVFGLEWHGMTLNLARKVGMALRVKTLLEIQVVGLPQGGWRLEAYLKKRPEYVAQLVGNAPSGGAACVDLESCADDLAEQILEELDPSRLLRFYIGLGTEVANRRILDLYQAMGSGRIFHPDELVNWGNAFFGLNRFDDALEKYQQALLKDVDYCPARIGRGLVYYYRNHGTQELADLKRAEEDFASTCGTNNKFAQTDLCDSLLKEWRISASPVHDPRLLTQAHERCTAALNVDQHFVRAAVADAYIEYCQGLFDKALKDFDDLSQKYAANSRLFTTYGFVLYREYLRGGRTEVLRQAIEKTEKSWNLNHGSRAAANNLAAYYYELGDYTRATELWERAILIDANDADSRAGLALGLNRANNPDRAFTSLLTAVRLNADYCHPDYLKEKHDWSERATHDLATLIGSLPDQARQDVHNLCVPKGQ